MKVVSNREEVVYRNDYNGKALYSIKISKKDEQGNWVNGFINCRFKKGVDIKNKTSIEIKDALLDFYNKDKTTNLYLFINEYIIIDKKNNNEEVDPFAEMGKQIEIDDGELPF